MNDVRKIKSRLKTDIDLDVDGKYTGSIMIPHSVDESAWGSILIPLTSIKNGDGPVILMTGGNHGDEYEGQIALKELAQKLTAEQVKGQVIIMPQLNYPAAQAGKRTSPIDGGNMNRAFPGDPKGTITEKIAHFVATELVARADMVLDIHSGGKTLDFIPSTIMHHLDDKEQMRKTYEALKAFGAPVSMILGEDTTGLLDGEVEDFGKVFVSTELGGKGMVTAETMKIARRGVRNILKHFKIIDGDIEQADTRFMDTPDGTSAIMSMHEGFFEPLKDLGDEVQEGEALARIWPHQHHDTEPVVYTAKQSGTFYARHVPVKINRGDTLAYVGIDIDPNDIGL